jgi:hypothetical protein
MKSTNSKMIREDVDRAILLKALEIATVGAGGGSWSDVLAYIKLAKESFIDSLAKEAYEWDRGIRRPTDPDIIDVDPKIGKPK